MIPPYILQQIVFDPDGGLQIGYYNPETDVREPGVARTQHLVVPAKFDYDDEIAAVVDAARYLIADVCDDFDALPIMRPSEEDHLP